LACPCGVCGGFGLGRFKNQYGASASKIERLHRYEYPGIHKAILHTFRAAQFYARQSGMGLPHLSSGYRCWEDNRRRGRSSTNHMGKAVDIDFVLQPGEDKAQDRNRCEIFRGILVRKSGFQIGWGAGNIKALEPGSLAPTWVHMDVRCYEPAYLDDRYFVTGAAQLDGDLIGSAAPETFQMVPASASAAQPVASPLVPAQPVSPPPVAAQPATGSETVNLVELLESIKLP
jgi:hypothetical protein